jgi:hypothetical protein
MNKIITNVNSNGKYHGYQEWYTDRLSFRGNFKNDSWIGYGEYHNGKETIYEIR